MRELRNAVERLLILCARQVGDRAPTSIGSSPAARRPRAGAVEPAMPSTAPTFEEFKQEAETSVPAAKLREHDWNVSETARALDMPRSNLYKKIERYGLTREPS